MSSFVLVSRALIWNSFAERENFGLDIRPTVGDSCGALQVEEAGDSVIEADCPWSETAATVLSIDGVGSFGLFLHTRWKTIQQQLLDWPSQLPAPHIFLWACHCLLCKLPWPHQYPALAITAESDRQSPTSLKQNILLSLKKAGAPAPESQGAAVQIEAAEAEAESSGTNLSEVEPSPPATELPAINQVSGHPSLAFLYLPTSLTHRSHDLWARNCILDSISMRSAFPLVG